MKRKPNTTPTTTTTAFTATEPMGICEICGKEMVKGRRVMPNFESIGSYVHVTFRVLPMVAQLKN